MHMLSCLNGSTGAEWLKVISGTSDPQPRCERRLCRAACVSGAPCCWESGLTLTLTSLAISSPGRPWVPLLASTYGMGS